MKKQESADTPTSKGAGAKGCLLGHQQLELPLVSKSAQILSFPSQVALKKGDDALRRLLEFAERLPAP